MRGTLASLVKRYDMLLDDVMVLPLLGQSKVRRGDYDQAIFPKPEIENVTNRSKDPNIFSVDIGSRKLYHLLAPMTYWRGLKLTHNLVYAGVHPEDIVISTANFDKDGTLQSWTVRNSIDWLFWTGRDQRRLEATNAR